MLQSICDCHMHVFDRLPVVQAGRYTPPARDLTDYVAESQGHGIRRAVLVQASVDGTDNRRLVRALRSATDVEARGVAMIDALTPDLDTLHSAGVRALRIQDRSRLGLYQLDELPTLAARAADMGWHVELNTEPERYPRLAALMDCLPQSVSVVLDHMGHVNPDRPDQIDALCRLLDGGRIWVKLALTRVSRRPDHADLSDLVRRIVTAHPQRCLWGSDWPHVMTDPPLPEFATMLAFFLGTLSSAQFHALMWTNPAVRYGFEPV